MNTSNIHIALIGGSGLYQMPGLTHIAELKPDTPFGPPSDTLITGELNGIPVVFLSRHGQGHILAPSEVPYRANIYALKSLGVRQVIAVNACGSLREELKPGHVVVPDQLFDFTKDRARTFLGEGVVGHISVADPYCATLSQHLADATERQGGVVHRGGAFIIIEGPRFSTKAESRVFRSWGMDIVGMTACPEAFLAREAGMCYASMAHVTDFDVWHESEETVTVEMVIERLNANVALAQRAIADLVPRITQHSSCACHEALANALITARDRIPDETRRRLHVITAPYL
ncbi:MAG: S-methyl-5'-thioadenosine phosphorylase [Anaerolineae bacterium]|nr:S-methyl-5'-thioadenosine phosphorylase [Anaerolineae bacterium]